MWGLREHVVTATSKHRQLDLQPSKSAHSRTALTNYYTVKMVLANAMSAARKSSLARESGSPISSNMARGIDYNRV